MKSYIDKKLSQRTNTDLKIVKVNHKVISDENQQKRKRMVPIVAKRKSSAGDEVKIFEQEV